MAAVLFAGCDGSDHFYDHVFYLDNQTGGTVEIFSAEDVLLAAVEPGGKIQFETKSFQCSKNAKSVDYFPDAAKPIAWWNTYKIKVGDEFLLQDVWLRKNWTFEGWKYYSGYTLTLDDELAASLLPQEEEPEDSGEEAQE